LSLILNIDTSTENASLALASDGKLIANLVNEEQKDHAAWIHSAIEVLLRDQRLTQQSLQAVAVTGGPGSYTGLRVGMATAKGLCFALKIPLVVESTLKVMAYSMLGNLPGDKKLPGREKIMICPMIDARRDEVFTAVYDLDLNAVMTPQALVLSQDSFQEFLSRGSVMFFGSGSNKWKSLYVNNNAHFIDWNYAYFNLAYLSFQKWAKAEFADLAYVQPDYLKEFHTYKKK
jgi:tRNA threonylcarbamoyladenosine biosynthesis protein TsaB